jgi:hypothetical protein
MRSGVWAASAQACSTSASGTARVRTSKAPLVTAAASLGISLGGAEGAQFTERAAQPHPPETRALRHQASHDSPYRSDRGHARHAIRRAEKRLPSHGWARACPGPGGSGGAGARPRGARRPQRVDPDQRDAERLEHFVQRAQVQPDPWLPRPEYDGQSVRRGEAQPDRLSRWQVPGLDRHRARGTGTGMRRDVQQPRPRVPSRRWHRPVLAGSAAVRGRHRGVAGQRRFRGARGRAPSRCGRR